jgi:hypothetical protein
MATAATTIISGLAGASANANGGNGGSPGTGNDGNGGFGAPAKALATASSGSGSATALASAMGGNGGVLIDVGGAGGDASATSTAIANGSGNASSSANATGGYGRTLQPGGNATAMANATASGSGQAIATAFATSGVGPGGFPSTAHAESNAKTDFDGVSVQSNAPTAGVVSSTSSEAIAQVGSGQTSPTQNVDFYAISTALPDKAYATTLIDGANNVADALLGPDDEIIGTAVLRGGSSTFDFSFRGDLILAGITGNGFFDITANGTDISEALGENSVINLGSIVGPINLTIDGVGVFAFGGAVPEPSTWAMMLLGFAGLGFAGYRSAGGSRCWSRKFST